MKKLVIAFALILVAASAHAATVEPILSKKRLSVAAGLNYAAFSRVGESASLTPPFSKEWETGLYGAYNLTPRLSLTGSTVLGLDNKLLRSSVGLRVRLFRGGDN